jgi:cytoskeletal protein RodZ
VSVETDRKQQREARGISLDEIAAATKVTARYLRAFEERRYADLPGGIFNRGIARGYCGYLELDVDEALRELDAHTAANAEGPGPEALAAFAENVRRNREGTRPPPSRWWGVLMMLVALAALAWAAWHFVLRERFGHQRAEPTPVGLSALPSAGETELAS